MWESSTRRDQPAFNSRELCDAVLITQVAYEKQAAFESLEGVGSRVAVLLRILRATLRVCATLRHPWL